jgi:hypothetical protein
MIALTMEQQRARRAGGLLSFVHGVRPWLD